jgi:hypothetical protein
MVDPWPFDDPRNVAVFTVRAVMTGRLPVLVVCHDEDDGRWQFLTGKPLDMKEALLVTLESVVRLDPTLADLADLRLGWQATRAGVGEPWASTTASIPLPPVSPLHGLPPFPGPSPRSRGEGSREHRGLYLLPPKSGGGRVGGRR